MNKAESLLGKIAALRVRLEQAQTLAQDASHVAANFLQPRAEEAIQRLHQRVSRISEHAALLDGTVQQLTEAFPIPGAEPDLPGHLTARAVRLLEQTRGLVDRLREVTESSGVRLAPEEPLARFYQETVLLTELVLRTIQTFPEAATLQLRLCAGIELVLHLVQQRIESLKVSLGQRRSQEQRLEQLAGWLDQLAQGQLKDLAPFLALTNTLIHEANQGQPLVFHYSSPATPGRFVAGHGLNCAQVLARIARLSPEWREQVEQPVLAGLLHDVGMLRVPAELLAGTGGLDEQQRGLIEAHTRAGAALLESIPACPPWLLEVTRGHHERLDGTGYPAGLGDMQIEPLLRLVAVADVYAALCCPRPYRVAQDTRTALTDTLQMAQSGILDRNYARLLLELAFYPVGTAVELADGACGVVVATHQGRRDGNTCGRPVVALLSDSQGAPLPFPLHVDLNDCQGRSIVRSLPAQERQALFGDSYPQWA